MHPGNRPDHFWWTILRMKLHSRSIVILNNRLIPSHFVFEQKQMQKRFRAGILWRRAWLGDPGGLKRSPENQENTKTTLPPILPWWCSHHSWFLASGAVLFSGVVVSSIFLLGVVLLCRLICNSPPSPHVARAFWGFTRHSKVFQCPPLFV